jgi:ketosteroid isomerase-like protein
VSAEENIATVRRVTDALVRRDYDAAAADLSPDFQVDDTDIPESTGADSLYEWMARWDEAWDSWRIEDLEVSALDHTRVLSLFRIVAAGKGSGIELARDDASITELRDGKVVRIAYCNDRARALSDAATER